MQPLLVLSFLLWFFQSKPVTLKTGDSLPPCVFQTASNEVIYTDSLKGNIVVIDFWASWNISSRKHNLQLLKMYEKYRISNFRRKGQVLFLSISLDTKRDLWLVARAKDDLHWPYNICDLKGWESEITEQLGLRIIPTNFVVNQEGLIVGKNMWGIQLDTTLRNLNKEMPN